MQARATPVGPPPTMQTSGFWLASEDYEPLLAENDLPTRLMILWLYKSNVDLDAGLLRYLPKVVEVLFNIFKFIISLIC